MMHSASEYFMCHLLSQTKVKEAAVSVPFSVAALPALFFPGLPLCCSSLTSQLIYSSVHLFLSLKNVADSPMPILCSGLYRDECEAVLA